jgi:pyrimidine operon attenuation protein/uracil phosphoribosyltransferase
MPGLQNCTVGKIHQQIKEAHPFAVRGASAQPICYQIELEIDKENPRNGVRISSNIQSLKNKSIIIIDDVLNSGSTLLYAVNSFLGVSLKKIQTVVLVNRNHKKFPIKADFKGISLSTSIKEHIKVVLNNEDKEGVFLS